MHCPITAPVATSSAANREVVPWLVVVRHGARSALFHRQSWLGTVEGLNLALLVHAQHQGSVRRAEVEADEILNLLDKPLVVRQLEPAREMGLQPVRMPNPLHTCLLYTSPSPRDS